MKSILIAILCMSQGCKDTSSPVQLSDPDPVSELSRLSDEFTVDHNGIGMKLRRKKLANTTAHIDNTLILLPSATYSTVPNWDLQYKDNSLMDFLAESGWVVYAIDLPGYGKSDNPRVPEMFGAVESAEYIQASVEFICAKHEIDSMNFLGWSWGAQAVGRFAIEHPQRVNKLVLCGFTYQNRLPEGAIPNGPYRQINFEGALSDFVEGCYEEGVREKYANTALESDQDQLVPAGPIRDYVTRLPIVDPTKLSMPVLVLCGQFEVEQPPHVSRDVSEYFREHKRDLEKFCRQLPEGISELVVIPGGGHAVHLEKPKHQWRKTVLEFLNEQ